MTVDSQLKLLVNRDLFLHLGGKDVHGCVVRFKTHQLHLLSVFHDFPESLVIRVDLRLQALEAVLELFLMAIANV